MSPVFSFVFAGLSIVPDSQFVARVSAFRLPIVGVLGLVTITTTTLSTVHNHAHDHGMACSVGTCNVSVSRDWDGQGRSVEARVPVDHASVGLAQARLNDATGTTKLKVYASAFTKVFYK